MEKEFLTSTEAATFLGVSMATLMNMCSQKKVVYYKLGRRNRFKLQDLRALVTQAVRKAEAA